MAADVAIELFSTWHQREPDKLIPLACSFQTTYGLIGPACEITYRSDKWPPFKMHSYIHKFNEPATKLTSVWAVGGGGRELTPHESWRKLTALGYCTGFSYKDDQGREISHTWSEATAPILAAIGKTRICLVPRSGQGAIPVIWTGLSIEGRGIVNVSR